MEIIILEEKKAEKKEMTSKEYFKSELSWFLPALAGGIIGAFAVLGFITWLGY